jgi:DNA-binding GntR family transcriptional regulator
MVALEREGLLTLDPHKGMVVYRPTLEDLQEIYRIRIPLEAQATQRAARFATDADLEELDEILDRLVHSDDYTEAIRLNSLLHDRIYAAARSPRLASLIADLRQSSRAYLALFTREPVDLRPHHAEHREILDALHAHSEKRAANAMRTHLTNSAKVEAALLAHQMDGEKPGS